LSISVLIYDYFKLLYLPSKRLCDGGANLRRVAQRQASRGDDGPGRRRANRARAARGAAAGVARGRPRGGDGPGRRRRLWRAPAGGGGRLEGHRQASRGDVRAAALAAPGGGGSGEPRPGGGGGQTGRQLQGRGGAVRVCVVCVCGRGAARVTAVRGLHLFPTARYLGRRK
jgi:hypothetical protein